MASGYHNRSHVANVRLEILAYAPTEFYHCRHCEVVWGHLGIGQRLHREQRANLLPDDLRDQYDRISQWIRESFDRYGDGLTIKVVDAVSIEGVLKSLRYGSRHFPVFIVDGQERIVGFDLERLDKALAERLGSGTTTAPPATKGGAVTASN